MEKLAMVLQWIGTGLIVAVLPLTIWQLIIGLGGLFPLRKRKKIEDKQHRFAVLICARNEEAVIGHLVDSLQQQNYPRECFQVFVVADNCTDATAAQARAQGATVYERNNKKEIGKGFALKWALQLLKEDYADAFDAMVLFDADNLVDADFLLHTNDALCSGADVTQGYRDSKNVTDTGVSACHAVYWLMLTRFYHRARYNWGMSCMVGGTGFAFKMHCIKDGWNTRTIGEDSEFTIQQVCAGSRIAFVNDAVFYDEQPTTWSMSIRQRYRWIVGAFQCVKCELPNTVRSLVKGNMAAFDLMMYLLFMIAIVVLLVAGLFGLAAFVVNPPLNVADLAAFKWVIWGMIGSTVWGWVSVSVVALASVLLEKKSILDYWKGILLYPVFLIPTAYMALMAMVRPKVEWKPIVHTKSKAITDMSKPN